MSYQVRLAAKNFTPQEASVEKTSQSPWHVEETRGKSMRQRPKPTWAVSKTARAVCMTAWTAIRTGPNHLCLVGISISETHFIQAVTLAAPQVHLLTQGLQVCDRSTTATDCWNFCWAADILFWGISRYFGAFYFHVQNSAYLCLDPYLSPVSYLILSPSSTEASVFKLIPSHSALHREHFIVMGQYLGPLVLQSGCFSWYECCLVLLE